jgi:hypothetical protein
MPGDIQLGPRFSFGKGFPEDAFIDNMLFVSNDLSGRC